MLCFGCRFIEVDGMILKCCSDWEGVVIIEE